jgi:meso-butanediol dehydrogenase/(S,S)-butanediol dehydrogenase/diacetyl reductase
MAGKTAVVTGSAGGIGAVTAELFCTNGARVVLCDRNEPLLAQAVDGIRTRVPGAELAGVACDITSAGNAERIVGEAVRRFGDLNVLVSNAAVRHVGTLEQTTPADWQRLLDVNLSGAANVCRAAMPELRRNGHGSVVIVSSCYALIGRKQMPIYDATKAGLLSLMRSLAWDGAPDNVRVNAVCPGGTITPYTIGQAQAAGRSEDRMRAEGKANALLPRYAEPLEVAYPIMWLASDEASYVTGATLTVDGGTTVM